MKTQSIANTPFVVSRIGFGCMRLPPEQSDVIRVVRTALDEGINFFDHANVYQSGRCEEAFSVMWSQVPGLRDRIVLQSKCGIRRAGDPNPDSPVRYDFSYQHIKDSVEGSLKRLKTDHLDILLLHRPDPLADPEEVAKAFAELKDAGKVRFFGVSNHTGPQIELLKTALSVPLVANQLEISILHNTLLSAGVITNQDNPTYPVRGEGTLEYCHAHKITVQAWSPLARGLASGKAASSSDERAVKTAAVVEAIATAHSVSHEAVVIAWLLKHPAKIQPIIGTMTPARISACCQADGVDLTREEWYTLFSAGRGANVP